MSISMMWIFETQEQVEMAIFVAFFLFRYLKTIVGIFAFICYQPKPIKFRPLFKAEDVSVIVPTTLKNPQELLKTIRAILLTRPARVYVVSINSDVNTIKSLCQRAGIPLNNNHSGTHTLKSKLARVQVIGVSRLNKRLQMLRGLEMVNTKITVFADDDVYWPDCDYLNYLLAIFENPGVGARGTRQRVRRQKQPNVWNILGISYLERRVFNNIMANAIDGSISTLSGRTAAYRTEILKTDEFTDYFTGDKWLGRPLNSDDDKCLTRYVYSHDWKIAIQSDPRSIIETNVESDIKYLDQCLRWARAHWRGNFTVMCNEEYWLSIRYLWGAYAIYAGQFHTPAILIDGVLFWLLKRAMQCTSEYALGPYALLVVWVVFTKLVKMIPHFIAYPEDVFYVPTLILFSYLHGFLNIYALFTLTKTHWGTHDLVSLEKKNDDHSPISLPRDDDLDDTHSILDQCAGVEGLGSSACKC